VYVGGTDSGGGSGEIASFEEFRYIVVFLGIFSLLGQIFEVFLYHNLKFLKCNKFLCFHLLFHIQQLSFASRTFEYSHNLIDDCEGIL
jgi:hypothetical protein